MKRIIVFLGLFIPSIAYSYAKYVVGNCEYRDYINTWKGEYYTLSGYSGSCTTASTWTLKGKQSDDWLKFSWGTGYPGLAGQGDYFGVRWKGIFKVDTSGTYKFCAYTDDGVRMYVNGTEYRLRDASNADCWRDQGATHCSVDINLSAGYHFIEVQYCESTGAATAWFGLNRAGNSTCGDEDYPFPVTQIYMPGLRGEYYTDASPGEFTSLKGIWYENNVGFNWGTSAPSWPSGMPYDYFSVRWTGNLVINTAGTYQFCVRYNDGAKLIIDDGIYLNNWNVDDTTKETAPISVYLTPGLHLLVLEFFESQGNAVAEIGSPQLGGASCDSNASTAITPIPERFLAISEKACNPTSPGILAGGGCVSTSIKRTDLYLVIPVIFLVSILIRMRFKRK
jgi:hypothetical protein